jgi:hypothetical protein
MEVAIGLDLPIIGVNLNKSRVRDDRCPSAIKDELVIFVPFGQKIIAYSMDNWPSNHKSYHDKGENGAYHYKDSVYEQLRIAA